ncbi:MAG: hypothetical protein HGA87_01560 [Desulfobulbaceae bacterium]|nr:hypothetical protein [Desulfobulbaceae bacterium]
MRLTIEEEKTEPQVRMYLEKAPAGYVVLCAKLVGTSERKALLTFHENGTVRRSTNATIGDYKFDGDGRLIIE